jgi:hypothetical protein
MRRPLDRPPGGRRTVKLARLEPSPGWSGEPFVAGSAYQCLGETGPLRQGVQEGRQALRILHIHALHGVEVHRKRPMGSSDPPSTLHLFLPGKYVAPPLPNVCAIGCEKEWRSSVTGSSGASGGTQPPAHWPSRWPLQPHHGIESPGCPHCAMPESPYFGLDWLTALPGNSSAIWPDCASGTTASRLRSSSAWPWAVIREVIIAHPCIHSMQSH